MLIDRTGVLRYSLALRVLVSGPYDRVDVLWPAMTFVPAGLIFIGILLLVTKCWSQYNFTDTNTNIRTAVGWLVVGKIC